MKIFASMEYNYQYDCSAVHAKTAYDEKARRIKGLKLAAILKDFLDAGLGDAKALDVGCSTGIVTSAVAEHVGWTVGIDIDAAAVRFAAMKFGSEKLNFAVQSSMQLAFEENTFDVVLCAHVYEHVPDAQQMMREIYRVLKKGGVCLFSAGNRIRMMEPHYRLPFLSVVPKWMAHRYLRLLGKGDHYYETHLSYGGLRRLASDFEILDYTGRIIDDPKSFHAEDVVRSGSFKQRISRLAYQVAPGICPTYLWLLRKT